MAELNPISIPVLAYKAFAYWTCCLCHYYYSPVLWRWQLLYACVMPVLCLAYIRILTVNALTAPNPSVPNSFLNGLNPTLLAFQCVSDLLSLLLWFIFANIPWKDDRYSMLSNDVYTWQILHILRGRRYRKELTILYYTWWSSRRMQMVWRTMHSWNTLEYITNARCVHGRFRGIQVFHLDLGAPDIFQWSPPALSHASPSFKRITSHFRVSLNVRFSE